MAATAGEGKMIGTEQQHTRRTASALAAVNIFLEKRETVFLHSPFSILINEKRSFPFSSKRFFSIKMSSFFFF